MSGASQRSNWSLSPAPLSLAAPLSPAPYSSYYYSYSSYFSSSLRVQSCTPAISYADPSDIFWAKLARYCTARVLRHWSTTSPPVSTSHSSPFPFLSSPPIPLPATSLPIDKGVWWRYWWCSVCSEEKTSPSWKVYILLNASLCSVNWLDVRYGQRWLNYLLKGFVELDQVIWGSKPQPELHEFWVWLDNFIDIRKGLLKSQY